MLKEVAGLQTLQKIRSEAEVTSRGAHRAPDVTMSFDGNNAPTELFSDLRKMGWTVPDIPPPPVSAITWEPDPIANTDYTLGPWLVSEFRLRPANWPRDVEVTITERTVTILRRHRVAVQGHQTGTATA